MSISIAAAALVAAIPPVQVCPGEFPLTEGMSAAERRDGRFGPPDGDALGDVWEEEEVSCWRGIWQRRGRSNIFDAYWMNPTGDRERATLQMWVNARAVIIIRRHSGGRYCRYGGTISADWSSVDGRYTCTWNRSPMYWRARIVRVEPS